MQESQFSYDQTEQSPQKHISLFHNQLYFTATPSLFAEWRQTYNQAFQKDRQVKKLIEEKLNANSDQQIQTFEGLKCYIQSQLKNLFKASQNNFHFSVGIVRFVQFTRIFSNYIQRLVRRYKELYNSFKHKSYQQEYKNKQIEQKLQQLDKLAIQIPGYLQWIDCLEKQIQLGELQGFYRNIKTKIQNQLSFLFSYCFHPEFYWRLSNWQIPQSQIFLFSQIDIDFIGAPSEAILKFLLVLKAEFEAYENIKTKNKKNEAQHQKRLWQVIKYLIKNQYSKIPIQTAILIVNQLIDIDENSTLFSNKRKQIIGKMFSAVKNIYFHSNELHTLNTRNKCIFFDLRYVFYLSTGDKNFQKSFQEPTQYLQWTKEYENIWMEGWKQSFHDKNLLDILLYKSPQSMVSFKKKSIEDDVFQDENIEQILGGQLLKVLQILKSKSLKHASAALNTYLLSQDKLCDLINSRIQFQQYLYNKLRGNPKKSEDVTSSFRFIEMQKILKEIYYSFGQNIWLFPTSVLSNLNIRFFEKFGDDIKNDVKQMVYYMMEKMGKDQLGQKIVVIRKQKQQQEIFQGENLIQKQIQLKMVPITRLEYLDVIILFAQQCSKNDQHINIPEMIPCNFESAIVFVHLLKKVLGHHQPPVEKKIMYCQLLDELWKMGVKCQFDWFANYRLSCTKENSTKDTVKSHYDYLTQIAHREQFQLICSIPSKYAKQYLFQAIKDRDNRFLNQYHKHYYESNLKMMHIAQYSILNSKFGQYGSISEIDCFSLLDDLRKALIQLQIVDPGNLQNQEMVKLNYIRNALMIYNTKIKQAKGSQIYQLILMKITFSYLECFSVTEQQELQTFRNLKKMYPELFEPFLYVFLIPQITTKLIQKLDDLYACNTQKVEIYQESMLQKLKFLQKILQQDLKNKIETDSLSQNLIMMISALNFQHPNMSFAILLKFCNIYLKFMEIDNSLTEIFSLKCIINVENLKLNDWKLLRYVTQSKNTNFENPSDFQLKNEVSFGLLKHITHELLPNHVQEMTLSLIDDLLKAFAFSSTQSDGKNIEIEKNNLITAIKTYKCQKQEKKPFLLSLIACQLTSLNFFISVQQQQRTTDEIEQMIKNWNQVLSILQKYDDIMKMKCQKDPWTISQVEEYLKDMPLKLDLIQFSQSQMPPQLVPIVKNVIEIILTYFGSNKEIIQFCSKYSVNVDFSRQGFLEELILGKSKTTLLKRIIASGLQDKQKLEKSNMFLAYQRLKQAAVKCVDILEGNIQTPHYLQQVVLHHHIVSRLISINQHFPSKKLQDFILTHFSTFSKKVVLQCHIKQPFLQENISQCLKKLPQNIVQTMLLKNTYLSVPNESYFSFQQYEQFHSIIVDIFSKLPYINPEAYNCEIQSMKEKQIEEQIQIKKQESNTLNNEQQNDQGQWKTQSEDNSDDWVSDDGQQKPKKIEKKQIKPKKSKISQSHDSDGDDSSQAIDDVKSPFKQDDSENDSHQEHQDSNIDDLSDNDSQGNMYDQQRPDILEMFYRDGEENKQQLKIYKRYIQLRQQIGEFINSDYSNDEKSIITKMFDPHFFEQFGQQVNILSKIKEIIKILSEDLTYEIAPQIINKMPQNFYKLLKNYGFQKYQQQKNIISKQRKPIAFKKMIKKFNVNSNYEDELLSESSYSEDQQNDDQFSDIQQEDYEQDSSSSSNTCSRKSKKQLSDYSSSSDKSSEQNYKFEKKNSKVTAKGNKNQKDIKPVSSIKQEKTQVKMFTQIQLLKIVEICVYCLITGKSSDFMVKLIKSKLGLLIVDLTLNILRIDQNKTDYLQFMQYMTKKAKKQELEVQQLLKTKVLARKPQILNLDLKRGAFNIIHAINLYQREQTENKTKILLDSCGTITPLTQLIHVGFNIPVQSTRLTILLLYLKSNSNRLKQQIMELKFISITNTIDNSLKLTDKQLKMIIQSMHQNECSPQTWELIQETLNLEVKYEKKLQMCYQYYGQRLCQTMWQLVSNYKEIEERILNNPGNIYALSDQPPQTLKRSLSSTLAQHTSTQYQLYSSLLKKYQGPIKNFYQVLKHHLRKVLDNVDNLEQDVDGLQKLTKWKPQVKQAMMTNEKVIKVIQIGFFMMNGIREKFHNKIQQKRFHRLLRGPQQIISAAIMIIKCFVKRDELWKDFKYVHEKEAEQNALIKGSFIKDSTKLFGGTKTQAKKQISLEQAKILKYEKIRSLQALQYFITNNKWNQLLFNDLQQVSKLVFLYLDLHIFCKQRYQNIIVPHIIRYPQIANKIPLIFKAPALPEQTDGQRLFITRQCSFDMAFYQLKSDSILVQYHQEQGSDHGGIVRQFMMGWKNQEGVGQQFLFIGKLLAISFKQGIPYGGKFDYSMASAITKSKLTLDILKDLDEAIYKSLLFIESHSEDDGTIESLCLNFVIEKKKYGKLYQFELIPNGSKIQLTFKNKNEYVERYLEKYLSVGREWQLKQLTTGFYTIINEAYISIFTPAQLLKKIKGQQIIDCQKLKKRTKYEEGYSESTPIIKWFWQILETFNQQQMNKFVQFLTGSPKLSIYDWNFQMTIQKVYDTQRFPVAHTCFNTLDLPEYSSKEILEKKFMFAIFEGNDNFGIL